MVKKLISSIGAMFLFAAVALAEDPMQKHVQDRYEVQCEERRKHLEEELEKNPSSDYIKFLLEQLKERCDKN